MGQCSGMHPEAWWYNATMIDEAEAVERARAYVASKDESFELIDEETREETFGRVFFYRHPSERLAETHRS